MLLRGAFKNINASSIRELLHIELSGGEPPGEAKTFVGDATALAEEAMGKLEQLFARYDDINHGYVSRAVVERRSDVGDYDHLARVREWSLLGDGEW